MKKYIFLLAAALIGLTSCEDWLDKTPQSKLTPDTFYKTATDLQLITNSKYNNLINKTPYAEQSDQYIKDQPSDIIRGGSYRTVPASSSNWSWGNLRSVNTTLEHIQNCDDPVAVKQYSAICKFFRAMFYFSKVKMYGDVPWIDTELGSADEQLYYPRDSREVIMTHMIEDINEAAENLPESYSSNHHYRATKWAALALKARFCLFEGTFRKYHNLNIEGHDYKYYLEQAAEAAEKLMTESPHKLYTTGKPNEDYVNLFASYDENINEYILSINYDYGIEQFHNATGIALVSSQGRYSLTKKFVNAYLMADGSRFTDQTGWETMQFKDEMRNRDPRLGQTVRLPDYKRIGSNTVEGPDFDLTQTGYHMVKFVMPAGNMGGDRIDKSYNDLPIYRLGEVYLNFAEAKAELGTLTQEDLDRSVNLLRKRVGMPNMVLADANSNPDPYLFSKEYGYPNIEGANKGIILEIRRERAVELAQEGLRYMDLLRWKAGYCMTQPILGTYFPGTGIYDVDGDGKNDIAIYAEGEPKPASNTATFIWQLGKDVFLSQGDKGCLLPYHNFDIQFDENRDYLLPIPINDRTLNQNLTQNPGWDDGLSF